MFICCLLFSHHESSSSCKNTYSLPWICYGLNRQSTGIDSLQDLAFPETFFFTALHILRQRPTCPLHMYTLVLLLSWSSLDSTSLMSAWLIGLKRMVMMLALCQGSLSNHAQYDPNWALCVINLQDTASHGGKWWKLITQTRKWEDLDLRKKNVCTA